MSGDETDQVEELLAKAGASSGAPKNGKTRKKRAPRKSQNARKDVVVQGVEGPVTLVDKSVNVLSDDATIAGNAPDTMSPAAIDLMGDINEAIDKVYKSMKADLSLAELGRIGIERHASIMAACEDEEEYPYAIEIMKLRLRRKLGSEKDAAKTEKPA